MELIRKHKIYFAVSEGYKDYLCSGTTTEGSAAALKSNPCIRDVHCSVLSVRASCFEKVEVAK